MKEFRMRGRKEINECKKKERKERIDGFRMKMKERKREESKERNE